MRWTPRAQLLQRVLGVDGSACPRCGWRMHLHAVVMGRALSRVLAGLEAAHGARAQARSHASRHDVVGCPPDIGAEAVPMLMLFLSLTAHADVVDVAILGANPDRDAVAWKVWTVPESQSGAEGIDCGYGGMSDRPRQGVSLKLSVGGTTRTWAIYETAHRLEDCTPDEAQKTRLAEAKRAFESADIDISAPLVTVTQPKTAKGFDIEDPGPLTVGSTPVQIVSADGEAADRIKGALWLWARDASQDEYVSALGHTLTVGDRPAITLWSAFNRYDGPHHIQSYVLAAAELDGHVAVVGYEEWCYIGGSLGCFLEEVVGVFPTTGTLTHRHRGPRAPIGPADFDKVELLGRAGPLVAVKWVGHFDDSAACGYAGMESYPRSHVALGLWDLAHGGLVERWDVYAPATGDGTGKSSYQPACNDRADQEYSLTAAKARFAELGIDIGTPLAQKPAEPPPPSVEDCRLPKGARPHARWGTDDGGVDLFAYAVGEGDRTALHLCAGR